MLTLPLPDTMRVPGAKPGQAYMVEGDLYNIVERIKKEVSPDLYVVFRDGHEFPFVVMEICADQEHRMVKRYAELDATVIEDLQRMLRVPFADRFRKTTDEIDAYNAKLGKMSEGEFEDFAERMQFRMFRTGLTDTGPHANYRRRPKR